MLAEPSRQFSIGDGCRGYRALRIDFVSHEKPAQHLAR
jgi:hypothetical protein